eukprot:scaffold3481_cov315-Pinguiococcus_pyrenoidosus.AAC.2
MGRSLGLDRWDRNSLLSRMHPGPIKNLKYGTCVLGRLDHPTKVSAVADAIKDYMKSHRYSSTTVWAMGGISCAVPALRDVHGVTSEPLTVPQRQAISAALVSGSQ